MLFARINGSIYKIPGINKECLTSDDMDKIREHVEGVWGVEVISFEFLAPNEFVCGETSEGIQALQNNEGEVIDADQQKTKRTADITPTLKMNIPKKPRCEEPGASYKKSLPSTEVAGPSHIRNIIEDDQIAGPSTQHHQYSMCYDEPGASYKKSLPIPRGIEKKLHTLRCTIPSTEVAGPSHMTNIIEDDQIAGPSTQHHQYSEGRAVTENVEAEDDGGRWTTAATKFFLVERLKMEEEFKKGKSKRIVLYGKLAKLLIEAGYSGISALDCLNKFKSLMATYRRNAAKRKATGESAVTWQYFKDMDDIFGHRDSINVPEGSLIDSLVPTDSQLTPRREPSSTNPYSRPKKTPKSLDPTILEFLQQRSAAEEEQNKRENDYMEQQLRLQERKIAQAEERNATQRDVRDILRRLLLHFERSTGDSETD